MGKLKQAGQKLLHKKSFVFTFLRWAASSQVASWIDLFLAFALFAWVGLTPWLSTALGAFAGGVANCVFNYRFTFHSTDVPWKSVMVKYIMVWVGSLLLNSFGTQIMYHWMSTWDWLLAIGFKPDGFFAAARLLVSLLVSWFWNFVLQRFFVYRQTPFDKWAIRFVDLFLHPQRTAKQITKK